MYIRENNKKLNNVQRVQSLWLSKDYFSRREGIDWIERHGFKYSKINTKNHYRFRQYVPRKNKNYRIKAVKPGIKFVFEF
jgi:hypothetical protein